MDYESRKASGAWLQLHVRAQLAAGRTEPDCVFISLETEASVGAQRVLGCRQREDPRPRPGPAWQVA